VIPQGGAVDTAEGHPSVRRHIGGEARGGGVALRAYSCRG